MASRAFLSVVQLSLLLLCISSLKFPGARAARILMMTFQQPSHLLLKLHVGSELVRQGHEVYVILASDHPMAGTFKRSGMHTIDYQRPSNVLYPFTEEFERELASFIFNRTAEYEMTRDIMTSECESILSNVSLLNDLKAVNFDLMLVEPLPFNPCYLLVPRLIGIRYVSTSVSYPPSMLRLPGLPSFHEVMIVGAHGIHFPSLETLAERLINFIRFVALHMLLIPKFWGDTSLLEKYAPEVSSWEELMLRSELILIENDYHLDSAMPLLPHVVTVAGVTARPSQPLPDDLERIMMQSGDDGVILASFGSVAYHMPSEIAAKFLLAFGKLKQTVVMRLAVPNGLKASFLRLVCVWVISVSVQRKSLSHGIKIVSIIEKFISTACSFQLRMFSHAFKDHG
jgi:hypothetical protein